MRRLPAVSAVLVTMITVPLVSAQEVAVPSGGYTIGFGGTRISAKDAARPAPRLPDGKPDLSGPWVRGGVNNNFEEDSGMKPGELATYLQPWAKKLMDSRRAQDEPYTACLPMAPPPAVHPYPWRIVQSYTWRGMTHIFIIHENGDSGAHRQIFMDGRKHPAAEDLLPTWFGHSIGRWEGDTLIIDTVGYNGKNWYDQKGMPYTDQLHTIERYSRPNYGTLVDNITIEDPGAFTRPINLKLTATHVRPDIELSEFICLENNQYGIAGGFTPGTGIGNVKP